MVAKKKSSYFNYNKLSDLIKLRYVEFLRITNHELLTLFWKVGVNVKSRFRDEAVLKVDKIDHLAEDLRKTFGPFFNSQNVRQMVEFSTVLKDAPSFHELALISWGHIQVLLNEKILDGWKYYLEIILKEKLSADELAKKISSDMFRNSEKACGSDKVKKSKNMMPFFIYQGESNISHSLIQNFFSEPLLHTFQRSMQPKEDPSFFYDKYKNNEWPYDLDQLVEITQAQHACRLNSRFNMFLYVMSGMINGSLESCPEKDQKLLVEKLSFKLSDSFGDFFTSNVLLQISNCTKKIPDILIFIRIANLVTWEHIVVLMSLEQIEYMLYYARLTANNGFNVEDLIAVIKGDKHKDINEALKVEKDRIDIIRSYTSTTSMKKNGNNITKMTEQIVDFGDDIDHSKAILNVFANRYLVNFMRSFQHNDLVY